MGNGVPQEILHQKSQNALAAKGALQVYHLAASRRRAPDCVQSRIFIGRGEPRFPALQITPPTRPFEGCATSKWCSASWRCRCPQLRGFWGSSRAGEGAGLRKSLRVLSQRKRSRWDRGRPPRDQGASPGGRAPAL